MASDGDTGRFIWCLPCRVSEASKSNIMEVAEKDKTEFLR